MSRRPHWQQCELDAWKPPENLTVSEWADRYRILDSKSSARPGPWRTDVTPFLRGIMDAFNDPVVEDITLMTSTQVGKTETIINALGYAVDQDQAPAMVVYPTIDLGKAVAETRVRPALLACPSIARRFDEQGSEKLELKFLGMHVTISGANSAAGLSSRPIRYLFLDEVDKYPAYLGKEGDPISLATERTKSFHNRKRMMVSSPTTRTGNIAREYDAADVRLTFCVPCPHCGHGQPLVFKQIKWTDELRQEYHDANEDPKKIARIAEKVRVCAWYECEECHARIYDKEKQEMLRRGQWMALPENEKEQDLTKSPRRVAFHLNSIYSPWISFGDVAAAFLEAKPFREKLRNFINGWLGEPFDDQAVSEQDKKLHQCQWTNERGIVPEEAQLITASVDVQKDHFWWVVRAWGERITSWQVDYGRAETWDEIEEIIINREFKCASGRINVVNLAMVDTGYRTDEAYEFCAMFPEVTRPCKGSSKPLRAPYQVTRIEPNEHRKRRGIGSFNLWLVDTNYYKDLVFGRMKKTPGSPGAFMLMKGCTQEYMDQISSEHKVRTTDRKTGKTTEQYQLVASHAQNHLLDCEVYACCAAEIAGIRYLKNEEPEDDPPRGIEVEQERPRIQPGREPPRRQPESRKGSWATGHRPWRR